MNDEENVLIASTVSPCLFQYRVWDTAHGAFVDHILLAQDGRFLLNLGDTVVPSIEPERYLVEFATGYTDKNSTMIFQGDLVKNKWGAIREVTWYDFEDCCVNGHTWMLGRPDPAKSTLYDALHTGEEVYIVGTIHTIPELLPPGTVVPQDAK